MTRVQRVWIARVASLAVLAAVLAAGPDAHAAESIVTPEHHAETAFARVAGAFGDDRGGAQGTSPLPFAGDGWGLRLGYRHRPEHWVDLSVLPTIDI